MPLRLNTHAHTRTVTDQQRDYITIVENFVRTTVKSKKSMNFIFVLNFINFIGEQLKTLHQADEQTQIDRSKFIYLFVKADTNNHINGGKHYRWTERRIALTTAQH